MMNDIIIEISGKEIKGELNNSLTAKRIYTALPLESSISRWGDEIYFEIPIESKIEDGIEFLDEGSLAYWPPGNAFCIFFGGFDKVLYGLIRGFCRNRKDIG